MSRSSINRSVKSAVAGALLSTIMVAGAHAGTVTLYDTVSDAATKGTSAYSGYSNHNIGPDLDADGNRDKQIFENQKINNQYWGDALQSSSPNLFNTSMIKITRDDA